MSEQYCLYIILCILHYIYIYVCIYSTPRHISEKNKNIDLKRYMHPKCSYVYHICIHLSADGHLVYFYILAIINSAAMKILGACIFSNQCYYFFQVYVLEWNCWVIEECSFQFSEGHPYCFPQQLHQFISSPTGHVSSSALVSLMWMHLVVPLQTRSGPPDITLELQPKLYNNRKIPFNFLFFQ